MKKILMTLPLRRHTWLVPMAAGLISVLAANPAKPALPSAGQQRNLQVEMGSPKGAKAYGPDLQKQRELLATIQTDAPPGEKAVACKLLTIHGTDQAVPVLTPLLANPELASWARIALEAIPGPTVDAALRDALNRLNGNLLIGVINSLGVRGDEKAIDPLTRKLNDPNHEVAAAAAVALGKIGGSSAAKVLQRALAKGPDTLRPAAAEGCIRCAEQFLDVGKASQARKLYDAVRDAKVSQQRVLEATRGAILARGDSGIRLLLEQLRSEDKDRLAIGLSTARELPGRKATEAIAAEVARAPEARQPMILLALADRRDPAAIPTVVEAARTGSKPLRLTAVSVLERLGTLNSVPVLIEVGTSGDAQLSQAALDALTRISADGMETDLLSRLNKSAGREREFLIRVAGARRMESALPTMMASAEHPDPAVRAAALQALSTTGGERQISGVIRLLQRAQPGEREELETALLAISGRAGAPAVKHLAPLAKSPDVQMRGLALRGLAACGGTAALATVIGMVNDADTDLQDEAVRALASWPSTWPDDDAVAEPLFSLAKDGRKKSHQVLALRGYLQYIQSDRKLSPDQKVQKIREVLPLMQRPEEKQLAISVLDDIANGAAIDLLTGFAAEDAVREEACAALLKIGSRGVNSLPKEQRQKALQAVLDHSEKPASKNRAQEKLKSL